MGHDEGHAAPRERGRLGDERRARDLRRLPDRGHGGERAGPAADVYGLGGVLLWALAGRVAFERPTAMAKLWAHVNVEAPRVTEHRPELPAELDAVVRRALA